MTTTLISCILTGVWKYFRENLLVCVTPGKKVSGTCMNIGVFSIPLYLDLWSTCACTTTATIVTTAMGRSWWGRLVSPLDASGHRERHDGENKRCIITHHHAGHSATFSCRNLNVATQHEYLSSFFWHIFNGSFNFESPYWVFNILWPQMVWARQCWYLMPSSMQRLQVSILCTNHHLPLLNTPLFVITMAPQCTEKLQPCSSSNVSKFGLNITDGIVVTELSRHRSCLSSLGLLR